MFKPQPLVTKPVSAPKVSVKGLTMPKNSVKVGFNVKPQHVAKVNWGKANKPSQKSTSQL